MDCLLFDRTGSGVGLCTPAEELSAPEHAQAGVRVYGVVVLEPSWQKPHRCGTCCVNHPRTQIVTVGAAHDVPLTESAE